MCSRRAVGLHSPIARAAAVTPGVDEALVIATGADGDVDSAALVVAFAAGHGARALVRVQVALGG